MSFTDVAFAAGFASLRQFNETVKEVFDATPTELRAKRQPGSQPGGALSIRLPFRAPLAAEHLMAWAAYRAVEGVAAVDGSELVIALQLPRGNGLATLSFDTDWVNCRLELDAVGDLAPAVAQCRTMFDLDADPAHIDATLRTLPSVAGFVDANPGLRSPGSADGFATLVFAILGQQRSVVAARTLAGRIVTRARGATTSGLAPFPGPAVLRGTRPRRHRIEPATHRHPRRGGGTL